MKPIHSVSGETRNWVNYKTGVKDIFFRMDFDKSKAYISIEICHADPETRQYFYEQLVGLKKILENTTGEEWDWHTSQQNASALRTSQISKTLSGVTIFNESDWPSVISFFKPRIIALDEFWYLVKDSFE